MLFTLFEEQRTPLNSQAYLASLLFNCTHYLALRFFAKGISCMNSQKCCSTIFFVIYTASPFVLTRKAKSGYFMSMTLYKPTFFLYYMYKESGTSTDGFSMKEATFNLKLAECMQKTCSNLNAQLPKNRSNALTCNFHWRLSHIGVWMTQ